VYPPNVIRKQIGKNVIAATNTHATIKELLNESLSTWSVPCQGNSFCRARLLNVHFIIIQFYIDNEMTKGGEGILAIASWKPHSGPERWPHPHSDVGLIISCAYNRQVLLYLSEVAMMLTPEVLVTTTLYLLPVGANENTTCYLCNQRRLPWRHTPDRSADKLESRCAHMSVVPPRVGLLEKIYDL
jgi:hypothetical protein